MSKRANPRTRSHEIHHQTLIGQHLTFTAGGTSHHHIGPVAKLERCALEIRVSGGSELGIIAPTDLVDCRINVTTRLKNFQSWWEAKLIRCSFEGRYAGNDFGHWQRPENYSPDPLLKEVGLDVYEGHVYGDVVDCDFTKAILDGCRFINVEMSRVKLPGWPHVTFLHPHRFAAASEISLTSDGLRGFLGVVSNSDPQVTGIVSYLPEWFARGDFTETDFRDALRRMSGHLSTLVLF